MANTNWERVKNHPDFDEIVAKLSIGISAKDINEWLRGTYSSVSEAKFVLSESVIKKFKDTYLDFYNTIRNDLTAVKQLSTSPSNDNDLSDMVQNNPAYKDTLMKMANKELDIDTMLANMAVNIENRIAQIYDAIQEDPRNINTKIERVWIEYIDSLGGLLDKYHKWKENRKPDLMIQNNVTLQVVDQHISVFHDVIKEILAQMDLESSQYFLEVFSQKMSKLKEISPGSVPPPQIREAELIAINNSIGDKLV